MMYKSICTVSMIYLSACIQLSAQNSIKSIPDKAAVMVILQHKCNECHARDKPKIIFTLENLDTYASKINKQVFIKKRMPKGAETKLTQEEWLSLKSWVDNALAEKVK